MSDIRTVPLALIVLGLAASIAAAEPGVETTIVRVRGAASMSPAAMRHLEERISQAALEVCGAAPGSLVEVKDAVAHTRCWQDSYANGMAQIAAGDQSAVAMLPPPSRNGKP